MKGIFMTGNAWSATHIHNLKLLKSSIGKADASLNNLGRTIHSSLGALESDLNRGAPHQSLYAPRVKGAAPAGDIFAGLLGNSGLRLSRGQVMSDIASQISKAMKRDM